MREVKHFLFPFTLEARKPFHELELTFPLSEYHRRVAALRSEAVKAELDAVVVLGDVRERGHIRWLTNATTRTGRYAVVVPVEGDPIVVTNASAHGEPMHSYVYMTWVPDVRACLGNMIPPGAATYHDLLVGALKDRHLERARVGIVRWDLLGYDWFTAVRAGLPDVTWKDATNVMQLAKATKSDLEIQLIERAQLAMDAGILAALRAAVPGATETEVAGELELAMRKAGMQSSDNFFPTRVSSGPRADLKNADPTRRRMKRGEWLLIDVNALYEGYVIDNGLQTVVGGDPTPEQEHWLETSALMAEAIAAAARPGAKGSEMVEVARLVARERGDEPYFIEYLVGHGIGTSQVEMPMMTPNSHAVMAPGMTFALEAMLFDRNRGTPYVEHVYVVTADGCRKLSQMPLRPWRDL